MDSLQITWQYYGFGNRACDHCHTEQERLWTPCIDGRAMVYPLIHLCADCRGRFGKINIMHCSNCSKTFDEGTENTIVVRHGVECIVSLCSKCTNDVRTAKIVIDRPDGGKFFYENFIPMRMAKSMSTDK